MSVWIPDTQRGDYGLQAKALGFKYVRKEHLRLNPLQPPRGCPLHIWFQAVAFLFAQAFGLATASTLVLFKTLVILHERLKARGRFPTMPDALQALQQVETRGNPDLAGYVHRITEKLEPLLMACPELDYEAGFDLGRMIEEDASVIWEMPDDEDVRAFFVLYFLYYVYHWRVRNRQASRRTVYFVLDECLHPLRARSPEAGIPLSTKLITQLRGLGVVLIVVTQLPGHLDQAARADLNVVVCFRNQAEQATHSARIMKLDPEQEAEVLNLKTGRMVLRIIGDRLKGPVLVDTPLFAHEAGEATEEELLRLSEDSVRDLIPRTKKGLERESFVIQKPQRDPDRLPADGERLLAAYEQRPMLMKLVAEELKWSNAKISRLVDEILKAGIWAPGQALANNRTYVATDTGREYCRRFQIKAVTEKSGTAKDRCHQIMTNSAEHYLLQRFPGSRSQSKGASFQVTRNRQVQGDRLLYPAGAGGTRVLLQACYKNSPGYEAGTAVRLAAMGQLGPDHVFLVAHSAAHRRHIEEKIDRVFGALVARDSMARWEPARAKVKLTHIDELLAGKFDLSWMKEGASS